MRWYQKLASRVRALRMLRNTRAIGLSSVSNLAVAILLIGILVPIGLLEIANANTTGWNANVTTVFQVVLPILAVIGLSLRFLKQR